MGTPSTSIFALSTAWNFQRHYSGKAMLEEIVALGFHWVELHQGLNSAWIPEIAEAVERGDVHISNLHNFCPLPSKEFQWNRLQFTAPREEERKQAIHLTQQTIDTAVQLGARYVVLNCGTVSPLNSHHRLRRLALQGKLYTKAFAKTKIREIQRREKESPVLKKRVIDCLRILGDYAGERGIRLGIENPKAYEGFPSEREFPPLLDELNHPAFGYWHNFGHAQIKHHLTLLDHREWLENIGSRVIGGSLDDIRGLDQQHYPPFSGVIPYKDLLPFLPQDCVFVFNLRGFCENQAILESVERWKDIADLNEHDFTK